MAILTLTKHIIDQPEMNETIQLDSDDVYEVNLTEPNVKCNKNDPFYTTFTLNKMPLPVIFGSEIILLNGKVINVKEDPLQIKNLIEERPMPLKTPYKIKETEYNTFLYNERKKYEFNEKIIIPIFLLIFVITFITLLYINSGTFITNMKNLFMNF